MTEPEKVLAEHAYVACPHGGCPFPANHALAPDPGAVGEPNDDEPGGFVMAGLAPDPGAAGEVDAEWKSLASDLMAWLDTGGDLDPQTWDLIEDRHRPRIEAALRDTAPALDVDDLAQAIAQVESQAPDDANEDERREWRDKAERILDRLSRRSLP